MIGLFKAVRDYQPDRDAAFQTFASICVDRQIYNAIRVQQAEANQPLNSIFPHEQVMGKMEEHLGDNRMKNRSLSLLTESGECPGSGAE